METVGGDVTTGGGDAVLRDKVIGADEVGKDKVGGDQKITTTTTTTTVKEPTITMNPQISLAGLPPTNETIIMYLMQQGQMLSSVVGEINLVKSQLLTSAATMEARFQGLEGRIENIIGNQESRFRTLERSNTFLEATINSLAARFNMLEQTNAELSHQSLVRSTQSKDLNDKVDNVAGEVAILRREVRMGQPSQRTILMQSLAYTLLILLFIGITILITLGLRFYR